MPPCLEGCFRFDIVIIIIIQLHRYIVIVKFVILLMHHIRFISSTQSRKHELCESKEGVKDCAIENVSLCKQTYPAPDSFSLLQCQLIADLNVGFFIERYFHHLLFQRTWICEPWWVGTCTNIKIHRNVASMSNRERGIRKRDCPSLECEVMGGWDACACIHTLGTRIVSSGGGALGSWCDNPCDNEGRFDLFLGRYPGSDSLNESLSHCDGKDSEYDKDGQSSEWWLISKVFS